MFPDIRKLQYKEMPPRNSCYHGNFSLEVFELMDNRRKDYRHGFYTRICTFNVHVTQNQYLD